MTQLAVETQAEVMEIAFPAIEEQTDYQFAQRGIPGNLVQLDGLLRVQPDNERLLLMATKGFASYAYGFIEDEMQQAELAGDLANSDLQRARARDMYLKARDYGLHLLRLMQADFPEKLPRDPDALKRLLAAEFTDQQAAPALFWTGNAWGSAINMARDDPALIVDLPFATVLVERSVELDEAYYNAAGHVFLGVANSSLGEAMGGDPEKGRLHFERALALTERKACLVHVNYAQTYAVHKQNKVLFMKLLDEVMQMPVPQASPLGLPNTIARRRAQRLLGQAETLILSSLDDLPPAEPEPALPAEAASSPEGKPPPEPMPDTAPPEPAAPVKPVQPPSISP